MEIYSLKAVKSELDGELGLQDKRLQLQRTGNLVLVVVDAIDNIKWQEFQVPNRCNGLGNEASLSFPTGNFSLLRIGTLPFLQVGSRGLELFNYEHKKIAQILSPRTEPLQFLALGNKTRNLALYYYSLDEKKFEAAYRAINTGCDLPLACNPYEISVVLASIFPPRLTG
ncbi:hypothetical protein RJ641_024502 [Dillenia turbinata]|uniref:Uncharacterized protein n=1 Tax=Dillenia turbinata TaxID=194707 RepID=A0AAN8VZU4_9MAGN